MNDETISIIIPVHNEAHRLEETLRALREAADLPYAVIVVDDLSTDGCTECLDSGFFPNVRLLRSTSRLGVASARNHGAREARTPIIVFMDGHCYPEAGFLSRMALALRRLGRGMVVPRITVHGIPEASGFGMTLTGPDLGATWLSPLGNDPYPVPVGCGCVQMFFRPWFEQIGGYDTMRTYGVEDLEISIKSWRLGGPVQVVPSAVVAHYFRGQTTCGVGWADVIYNSLRMGYLHFSGERLERIVRYWASHPNYEEARRLLDQSDVHERRQRLDDGWHRTADWYCTTFEIPI
jgi:GT2 family glycosyltransferase